MMWQDCARHRFENFCKWMGLWGMTPFPRERDEPPRTPSCGVSPSTLFPQESRLPLRPLTINASRNHSKSNYRR